SRAPDFLAPCVESVAAAISMAAHRPALLLDLTEAYYVVQRHERDADYWPPDEGVRHHRTRGLGAPMAGWYLGPFWQLLQAVPLPALALINRLLDHAAGARVRLLRRLADRGDAWEPEPRADGDRSGLEMELPGVGIRSLAGDQQAWA